MGDLISRQATINLIKEYERDSTCPLDYIHIIKQVPSIQPDKDLIHLQKEQAYMQGYADGQKPRKGKWILDPNGMDWNLPAWKCSLCGCKNDNIGVVVEGKGLGQNPLMWAGSNFCPNCGASMKEGDSDEVN